MNEDKVLQKLIEMESALRGVATTQQLKTLEGRITTDMDKQLVILQRLDQERLFTIERVKRIEEDVERIKLRLQLA